MENRQTNLASVNTGTIFVIIAAFGFSAKAIFIKLAYGLGNNIDPVTIMALRMSMALPFFIVAAVIASRMDDIEPLTRRDHVALVGMGFLGYYLSSFLDFSGLVYISAGLERVILYLYPTLVVVMTAIHKRNRIKGNTIVALLFCYMGVGLVFISQVNLQSSALLLGASLVAAATVCFSVFSVIANGMIHRIGAVRFTAYSMSVACLLTVLHFSTTHSMQLKNLPSDIYLFGAILAIGSTVIPGFMMSEGIKRIGADNAAIISSVGPIATIALAALLLGESVTVTQIAGTMLVLAGVYQVNNQQRKLNA